MSSLKSLATAYQALPGPVKGLALVVVSTITFSAMQALIRYTSREVHPFEIVFWRNLFGLIAMAPFFMRHGLSVFKTRRFPHHALRNGMHLCSMLMFFYGVSLTPLATVSALSFTSPLFAALGTMLLLGERFRLRRMTALVIGFLGTLVIIRPGFIELQTGSLLVLASSVVWGIVMVNIKSLGRSESSITSTAYMAVIMTPLALIPASLHWTWPSLSQIGWLALMGLFGTIAHISLAQAFRETEATTVLPADFLRLIWAALFGYAFFNEVPEALIWVGGAMIFGSTAYITLREAHLARRMRSAPVPPPDVLVPAMDSAPADAADLKPETPSEVRDRP